MANTYMGGNVPEFKEGTCLNYIHSSQEWLEYSSVSAGLCSLHVPCIFFVKIVLNISQISTDIGGTTHEYALTTELHIICFLRYTMVSHTQGYKSIQNIYYCKDVHSLVINDLSILIHTPCRVTYILTMCYVRACAYVWYVKIWPSIYNEEFVALSSMFIKHLCFDLCSMRTLHICVPILSHTLD